MTSVKGADVVAPGWYKYTISNGGNANTPDINDSFGLLNTTPGYAWYNGTPVASPDGGTWQNVFATENFAQTISGLTIGKTYYFRYYYASQGISTGPPSGGYVLPFPPVVNVTGATGYTDPSEGALFEWCIYSGQLIATSTSITIVCSQGENYGYMAFDGFYLGTNPPPEFLEISGPLADSLCNTGDAYFTVQSAAATNYQWQENTGLGGWHNVNNNNEFDGALTDSLHIKNVDSTMNNYQYRCHATSSCCSAYSAAAALHVFPYPSPSLKVNAISPQICNGKDLTISAGSGYLTYLWNNSSNDSTLTVNKPGVYWVEVKDTNNCVGRDSIDILPCEVFFMPNAFTPNNDGKNDLLKPVILTNPTIYKFSIYNRWGKLVFQTKEFGKGWDGTINGVKQNAGLFVWACTYQVKGGNIKTEKGTVVLIR